jgi:hypothetical protein
MSNTLRQFNQIHIDEDCRKLKGEYVNSLFYNCTFDNLIGLTLSKCDLNKSHFLTTNLTKALNFTLTLNCHSFVGVSYSELLFDLMLYLLTKTVGNDHKRKQIAEILGAQRVAELDQTLRRVE